MANLEIKRN